MRLLDSLAPAMLCAGLAACPAAADFKFLDAYTAAIGPEKAVTPIEDMREEIHPGHAECVLAALRASLAHAEEVTVELTDAGEARITIDRIPILVVADIALDNGLCEQPTL